MDRGRGEDQQGVLSADDPPRRARAERVDSSAALALLNGAEPPVMCWSAPDGGLVVGAGCAHTIVGRGPNRLETQRVEARGLFSGLTFDGPREARPRLVGGMRFDEGEATDPRWRSFPDSLFFLPRRQVTVSGDSAWLTTVGDPGAELDEPTEDADPLPTRRAEQPTPSREEWFEQVETARGEIAGGAYSKVVLGHALDLDLDGPVPLVPLIGRLREANPYCYVTAVRPTHENTFVAATPERLVTRSGENVRTDALAGSSERGSTRDDDERLTTALRESGKDRHEHDLVVDAIADGLERLGATVTVGERGIRKLQTVQHLHTPIEAIYQDTPHVLELVDALHPTPAVGGLPRTPALKAITRIETIERGWYAAPLGWFDGNGNGSFAIGIRSGVIRHTEARLFAGNGIVEESDPTEEWAELQLKYRPLLDLFTGE